MSQYPTWDLQRQAAAAPYLDAWAAIYSIPRDLLYGQCALESGFDAAATGSVGEIGLMQLRPTTAAMLGFGGTEAELYAPDTNVQYGALYLRNLYDRYGNWPSALSAYNAGRPITGNQSYVQGVLDRAAYFDQLFGTAGHAALTIMVILILLGLANFALRLHGRGLAWV
ncbi:MAG: lytic transglycosylase domain-containing protein [Gammaproteobacteria bacterium]